VKTQYWLAELDQYGNPTLVDGPHLRASGANKAAYLIESMHLGKPGRRFAVAKVQISPCVPSSKGVNQKAIGIINMAREAAAR
jgi:hypothetical protein